MKRLNVRQSTALTAARAARAQEDEPEGVVVASAPVAVPAETLPEKGKGGRPRGKQPIEARQTLYLDAARHEALARVAEDCGRSVHSLIPGGDRSRHRQGKATRVAVKVV